MLGVLECIGCRPLQRISLQVLNKDCFKARVHTCPGPDGTGGGGGWGGWILRTFGELFKRNGKKERKRKEKGKKKERKREEKEKKEEKKPNTV